MQNQTVSSSIANQFAQSVLLKPVVSRSDLATDPLGSEHHLRRSNRVLITRSPPPTCLKSGKRFTRKFRWRHVERKPIPILPSPCGSICSYLEYRHDHQGYRPCTCLKRRIILRKIPPDLLDDRCH